jgi:hypothetical protein
MDAAIQTIIEFSKETRDRLLPLIDFYEKKNEKQPE